MTPPDSTNMTHTDIVNYMARAKYLTLAEIAEIAGVTLGSIRTYRSRSEQNRAAGNPRPGDLPPEDITLGITPGWSEKTITRWMAERPVRSKK